MADIELDLEAEEDGPELDLGEDAPAVEAVPVEGIAGPSGDTGEAPARVFEPSPGISVPESVMIGAEQGIPFAPQIASGLETAVDVARHPSASILETYQANRNNRLARAQESQKTNPWAHGLASAGAGLGTAIAAAPYTALGAAGLGARALGNAVVDTGLAAAQRMNEGQNPGSYEAIRDMLFGRAIGKGISGVGGAIANPKKTAGQALEGAHNLYDSGMGALGRVAKYLGIKESGDEIADAAKSSKVINLEQKIKDAEFFKPNTFDLSAEDAIEHARGQSVPYRLATAAKEGRADMYDNGVSFNPNELGDDFASMYDDAIKQGQQGHYPKNWGLGDMRDSVRSARHDAGLVREGIERYDKVAAENLKETAVSGLSKKTAQPQRISTDDIRDAGSMLDKRGMRPVSESDPDGAQALADRLIGKDQARQRHLAQSPEEIAKAQAQERSAKERGDMYRSLFEKENAVASAVDRYKGMSEDTMNAYKQSRGDATARAKTLLEQMRQADATAGYNASMKGELDAAAAGAREQLGDIKTGRSVVDMGSPFNLAKSVLGLPGKGTGNIVQKVIDFGGAQGQRMAKTASLAEQWATRNDNLGRMAQWALSGDAEQAIVRLAILADMPEAQEAGIE